MVLGGDARRASAYRRLFRRVERRRAALLEIADGENARTQLRKPAVLDQSSSAHLLGGFLGAGSLDLAPVVLRAPLPVGPKLHLVGSSRLHRVHPMFGTQGTCGYGLF